MDLNEVVDKFPDDLKEPIIALVEFMRKEDLRSIREEMEKGFSELREAIKELTEAQKRTEERIEELVQAQKRTEERLDKHEERLNRIEKTLEELIQAQKRTEERVEELAKAQKNLAQAQKRTEETLNMLIKEHAKTREKVENLSHNFGFLLEDRAIQSLPHVLKKRDMEVVGELRPKRIVHDGKEYEINIYGVVEREGKRYVLFGESKSRVSKKEIYRFLKLLNRLKERLIYDEKADGIYPLIVVHRIRSDILGFLNENGIDVVESYELKI